MQKGFMPILEKKASIVKPKLIKDSSYAKYNVNRVSIQNESAFFETILNSKIARCGQNVGTRQSFPSLRKKS